MKTNPQRHGLKIAVACSQRHELNPPRIRKFQLDEFVEFAAFTRSKVAACQIRLSGSGEDPL